MKKVIAFLSPLLLGSGVAFAQYTAISATVVDSDSTTWAEAPFSWSFQPGPNQSNPANYTYNGSPLTAFSGSGAADGSGVISVLSGIYDVTLIRPIGASYNLTVCPNASSKCASINFKPSGVGVVLTSQVNAAITAPRFSATPTNYGYNDGEATLSLHPGSTYWNTTSSVTRCYSGSAWGACSGGGSGPLQTCDASTVPSYAPAVCVFMLTSADLLQFDGTDGTALSVITTPGVNHAIVVNGLQSTGVFDAGANPYNGDISLFGAFKNGVGTTDFDKFNLAIQTSLGTNQLTFGNTTTDAIRGAVPLFTDTGFSVYSNQAIAYGPVSTWSLASGGITDGANTTQITSGHAGLTYVQGDTPALACGATFYVDSVDAGTGAVLTYHQTAVGAGCATGTGQATTGGGNGTLELDVLTIGAGYRVNDTLSDSNFISACGMQFTVDTVTASGLVSTLTLTNAGAGCIVNNGIPLNGAGAQPGIGQGATVNVTGVIQGNGSIVLTIPYTVIPVQ